MKAASSSGKDCHCTVAIVGGGFAGAVTAAQILRKAEGGVSVALIERGEHPGKGVAYGTQCDKHLLNVPAALGAVEP
jgi:uncharacterized NAD(P)/FAD-binding protein YdhS